MCTVFLFSVLTISSVSLSLYPSSPFRYVCLLPTHSSLTASSVSRSLSFSLSSLHCISFMSSHTGKFAPHFFLSSTRPSFHNPMKRGKRRKMNIFNENFGVVENHVSRHFVVNHPNGNRSEK